MMKMSHGFPFTGEPKLNPEICVDAAGNRDATALVKKTDIPRNNSAPASFGVCFLTGCRVSESP